MRIHTGIIGFCLLLSHMLSANEVKGVLRIPGGPFYPGDIIELEMELVLPYEAKPLFPEEHPVIKGLVPYGNPLPERKLVSGKNAIWIKDYDYQAMDSLHSVVSDIELEYELNDTVRTITLKGVPLDVIRVPVDTTWMLRAAYQPLPPMMKWSWWPLVVLSGLLALIGIILFVRYLRRRPEPIKMPEGADPLQWSLTQLEQIRNSIPLEDAAIKEAFSRLSDVMRLFIQKTTGMPAVYLLTVDLMKRFMDDERFDEVCEELEYVMSSADMVKFAQYRPDAEMQAVILDKAIRVIRSACWNYGTEEQKKEAHA